MCLVFGLLDEKGEAVLTAQELVQLAGANPMVKLPQLIAFDRDNPSRKGSMHEGVTTTDVVKAITDASYHGPALAFLPEMWTHVVALSKMPSDTLLRDVSQLAPLFTLLHPMAEHQPISNGGERGAESLMKKIGKVCKAQQRLNDKIVSQNVGAVCRDPGKLYRLTEALDLEASYALGHNKETRIKGKIAVPIVAESDPGLGFTAEGEEGREEWGEHGSWNEETYVMPPKKAKAVRKAALKAKAAEGMGEEESSEDEFDADNESSDDDDGDDGTASYCGRREGKQLNTSAATGESDRQSALWASISRLVVCSDH